MDISTFRWILIIGGIAVLAAIFLLGSPEKSRKRRAARKTNRRTRTALRKEPTLDVQEQGGPMDELEPGSQAELDMQPAQEPAEADLPPPGPPPDKIFTLFVQGRGNHRIGGVDLLEAALKAGLVFGERDIFHRVMEDSGEIVFSMANLTKPGYFDKTSWNTFQTNGVTIFMTLPGPMPALDAWDAMLATSRRIAELLHADLLDEKHSAFTRQREGQIREELRAYVRSQQAEG